MKSLKVLLQKLRWLASDAEFDVTVNSVVGAGVANPADAQTIAQHARELGFSTTVGIIHDGTGRMLALDEPQRSVLEAIVAMGKSAFDFANYNRFQKNLVAGAPNDWKCRAGARYLYVCEDGLVHWCSQQRGHPGIPWTSTATTSCAGIPPRQGLRAVLHRRLRASGRTGRRAAPRSRARARHLVCRAG